MRCSIFSTAGSGIKYFLTLGLSLPMNLLFSPDVAQYLTIARTLAETGHYPPERMMGPPGFPTVIAPFMLLGATPFAALRLFLAACWATSAVLTYLLHRHELGEALGWIAGLFVATSPVLLTLTTIPLNESVFMVIATAALLVMGAWRRRPAAGNWEVAVGGLLAGAAFMVRSTAILLLPVMAITLLWRRDRPIRRRLLWAAIFAACSLGPAGLWRIRQSAYPPGANYMQSWATARPAENTSVTSLALQCERLARFGPLRLEAIKETVLPKELCWRAYHAPLASPTTWLIGGFFVAVALWRAVRHRCPLAAYAILTLLLLAFWPWDEGVRFVAPLIPIFAAYPLWVGLRCWRGQIARHGQSAQHGQNVRHGQSARHGRRFVVATVLGLLAAVHISGLAVVVSRMPAQRDKAIMRLAAMRELADWHNTNTTAEGREDPWLGITPHHHNGKTQLLGAAYLARRPVRVMEADAEECIALSDHPETCVFVHQARADNIAIGAAFIHITTIAEFEVFQQWQDADPPA